MARVLDSLLQNNFESLEDLPENIRNNAILHLATLISEGKLTGKKQFLYEFSTISAILLICRCHARKSTHWVSTKLEIITTRHTSER